MSTGASRTAGFDGSEIAICGMAGRFPGAPSVPALWENLARGVDSIRRFTAEEVLRAGEDPELVARPDYVRARGILEGIDLFDAAFFGFSPREAEILDPQGRLLLECAWEALENAGYDTERYEGTISLFAGTSFSNYLVHNLYRNRPVMESFGDFGATIYNLQDSAVTMVGYKLNLRGACCAVQTFCSTSLVGVHLACQSLLNYECDLAIAGGATVYVPQVSGYVYEEGGIVSPDGYCRTFDREAGGTVFGNGVALVVLKRLEDALRDSDNVLAVVRGSAVNNDGSLKVSYAAPGVRGQTEVVVEALAAAGVEPETIGLVEAHGTGTALGDPAEVAALTKAFRAGTDKKGYCALGSVKTNLGHLDAAAGVTGLIKVVLSLLHERIPPSLHFEAANPAIDFSETPFYVATELRDWKRAAVPRRAAVSAFGIGGTNAHVVLEEAPPIETDSPSREHCLLPLSAKSAAALDAMTRTLAEHLTARPEVELADVAYTLQVGRRAFAHRQVAIASGSAEAVRRLASGRFARALTERKDPPLVFLFPGEDAALVGRIRELYEAERGVRQALDRCAAAIARATGVEIFGGAATEEPSVSTLTLLAAEYALAGLWSAWGLKPQAALGEGVGELAAAAWAGVLPLEEAARRAAGRAETEDGTGKSNEPRPPAVELLSIRGSAIASDRGAGMLVGDRGAGADEGLAVLLDHPERVFLELGSEGSLGRRLSVRAAGRGLSPVVIASVPAAEEKAPAALLESLGRLWLAGVAVDWNGFYAGERRRRVPLPAYPFERQRYWVEPLEEEEGPKASPEGKISDPAQWFYSPVWKRSFLASSEERAESGRRFLFLNDERGIGAALARRCRSRGHGVVTVSPSDRFARRSENEFSMHPSRREDYQALIEELRGSGAMPDVVVHAFPLDERDGQGDAGSPLLVESSPDFYRLLHLCQALVASRPDRPLSLRVLTRPLHEVIGGEDIDAEKAAISGLCRVLPQEHHGIRCSILDLELDGIDEDLAESLCRELEIDAPEPLVAYRKGRRWLPSYEKLALPALEATAPRLKDGGVYLITGGLGEVGSALASYLAKKTRAKLVLLGRFPLPPRDRWDSLLKDDADDPASARMRKVRVLEKLGAEVLVLRADAAIERQMEAAVKKALDRFGGLDGVIHAAGDLATETFAPIERLNRELCERQLAPKIRGAQNLARILGDRELDFVLLASSLSVVLGGLGYGAYAAANACLDAFAAAQNQRGRTPWISVGWDQWSFSATPPARSIQRSSAAELSMTALEGIATFEHVLRLPAMSPIVVSTGALEKRMARWVELQAAPRSAGAPAAQPRPDLAGTYRAPRNEHERALAEIWTDLLGVDRVGIDDDFFALGGHSLFAARMLSRIRERFGVALPFQAVFDKPTVAELAERIQGLEWAGRGGAPEPGIEGERVEIEL